MNNIALISKPIPIKYVKSKYSFNDPNPNNIKYAYNLNLTMNDGTNINFLKINKKKYADLIDISDDIDYNMIKSYNIEISQSPSDNSKSYYINELFDVNINSYSKHSDDIYIEFTKNGNEKTICKCYFIKMDFNSIFISPPN